MMVDPNDLLAGWFRSIAALVDTAVLPDRSGTKSIYAVELPGGFDPKDGPGLVFASRGGQSDPDSPLIQPRFQITIYGDKLQFPAVRNVYNILYDAVNGKGNVMINGAGTILSFYEVTPPQEITDPDTEWATLVAFFELIAR